MRENIIRLLVRTLKISDYENTGEMYFCKQMSMMYLEGTNQSGSLGIGSGIVGCGIFPFDKERAGFSYISSLELKREGDEYVVTSILR